MNKDPLTKRQKVLLRDLEELAELLGLDWQNIKEYERESRTPHLERMKRHLILGEVIGQYTLIDEYLNMRLCHYFFGRKKSFIQLWRTRKFQNFNYHVLEGLSLLKKLAFVKSFSQVPMSTIRNIHEINALRNGLAHAFFPENLRTSKPIYKGKSIFSVEGLKRFVEDTGEISETFLDIRNGEEAVQPDDSGAERGLV